MIANFRARWLPVVVVVLLNLLASTAANAAEIDDPYENHNRHAFALNQTLDKNILKPLARVYNAVLPWQAKKGISNFFSNLGLLPTIVNDVLQVNVRNTASDSWRFVINSTVGVLGLVDVASDIGLPPHSEDLGLTLARWGYKNTHYLVLPFFGPSTVRDAATLPVNYTVLSVYPYVKPDELRYSLFGLNLISGRAQLLDFAKVIDHASFDPYTFQRNAYLQRRAYLIQQNRETSDDLYIDDNDA